MSHSLKVCSCILIHSFLVNKISGLGYVRKYSIKSEYLNPKKFYLMVVDYFFRY